jgi:outer membrane protein assembly factor BamB
MRACIQRGLLVVLAGTLAACSSGSSSVSCSFDDPATLAASSPWPRFHHDRQNRGSVVNANLADNPGTCLWVFSPGGLDSCSAALSTPPQGAFTAGPVLNGDGTRIYIGSVDGALYALDARDGTQITSFSFSIAGAGSITSAALVAARPVEGEVVFVGASNDFVYGLTDSAAAQPTYWPAVIGGSVSGPPNIGTDGTVYASTLTGTFSGVCPNGVERFVLTITGSLYPPAEGTDGTLYFGGDDHQLRAIQADGKFEWSFFAAGSIVAAPVFDTDTNSIYVADMSGKVFKVLANGRLELGSDGAPVFTFQLPPENCPPSATPCGIRSSPALAEDHLYFGSDDGYLYAIDKCTGALAWQFATGGAIASSPAVAIIDRTDEPLQPTTCSSSGPPVVHQRIVVVGSDDGNVYFVEDNDTSVALMAVFNIGAPVGSSPAIGSYGTVYVGGGDGRVYAIGAPLPSPTPAPSPSPTPSPSS